MLVLVVLDLLDAGLLDPTSPAHNLASRTPFPRHLAVPVSTTGTVGGEQRVARQELSSTTEASGEPLK